MKQKRKKFSLPLLLFLILLIMPVSVFADGMIINPVPYSDRWDYEEQTNQQAFINYENGLEKMIMSIGVKETSKGSVWIFPVPSSPDKVAVDVVIKLPQLKGEEITKKAKANLFFTKKYLQLSQLYTFLFVRESLFGVNEKGGPLLALPTEAEIRPEIETDVTIHEHLEKEGIATEIITAKNAQALYNYLDNKNLKVDEEAIPALGTYIGEEFTFVVSWFSGEEFSNGEQRGIFVRFPTKKIYYPLLLTSVYGSKVVPITIRIIGYVSPEISKDLKTFTKINYYCNGYESFYGYSESEVKAMNNFYGGAAEPAGEYGYTRVENVKYTKIEINAPSKMFTDDL